jgi:hypothetical protein
VVPVGLLMGWVWGLEVAARWGAPGGQRGQMTVNIQHSTPRVAAMKACL